MDSFKKAGASIYKWATHSCPCCRCGNGKKDGKRWSKKRGRNAGKAEVQEELEEMHRPFWRHQIDAWYEEGISLGEMILIDD